MSFALLRTVKLRKPARPAQERRVCWASTFEVLRRLGLEEHAFEGCVALVLCAGRFDGLRPPSASVIISVSEDDKWMEDRFVKRKCPMEAAIFPLLIFFITRQLPSFPRFF